MAHSIIEVKGIGKVTSLVLAKHGFKTVGDLANSSVDNLALTPGFSQIRATQIINTAKELLAPTLEKEPATKTVANAKVKKSLAGDSKPKKEKKKDKKEGKKKDKNKSSDKGKKKNSKKNKRKKEKQKKPAKKSK